MFGILAVEKNKTWRASVKMGNKGFTTFHQIHRGSPAPASSKRMKDSTGIVNHFYIYSNTVKRIAYQGFLTFSIFKHVYFA